MPATDVHPQSSPRPRPVNHAGACGVRVPSPHPECQAIFGPHYNGGELVRVSRTSMGLVNVVIVRCHGCGGVSQGTETTA